MKKKKIPDPDKSVTTNEWKAMGDVMHGLDGLPDQARNAVLRMKSLGRPKLTVTKEQINIRIDSNILAAFRATGKGWQTKINAVLANAVKQGL